VEERSAKSGEMVPECRW